MSLTGAELAEEARQAQREVKYTPLMRVVSEPYRNGAAVHYMTVDAVSTVTICGASRGDDDPLSFSRTSRLVTCKDCRSIRLWAYPMSPVE